MTAAFSIVTAPGPVHIQPISAATIELRYHIWILDPPSGIRTQRGALLTAVWACGPIDRDYSTSHNHLRAQTTAGQVCESPDADGRCESLLECPIRSSPNSAWLEKNILVGTYQSRLRTPQMGCTPPRNSAVAQMYSTASDSGARDGVSSRDIGTAPHAKIEKSAAA